jgi:hypothetical protein
MRKLETRAVIISFGRGDVFWCDGYSLDEEGMILPVTPCVIRDWGTTDGLGQLAAIGPRGATIFDGIPFEAEIPEAAVHGFWICNEAVREQFRASARKAYAKILEGK